MMAAIVAFTPSKKIDFHFRVCEEGLLVIPKASRDFMLEWNRISNVFCINKLGRILSVYYDDGRHKLGRLDTGIIFGGISRKLDELLQKWEAAIEEDNITSFSYPKQWRKEEEKMNKHYISGGVIAPLLFWTICVIAYFKRIDKNLSRDQYIVLLILFSIGLLGLLVGFYNLLQRLRKKYDKIQIRDTEIEVLYQDGSKKIFNARDIKSCRLAYTKYTGRIIFKDGTILGHLERVSYWPILRGYLLSKLEQKQ